MMKRFKAILEYDGTDFSGWQIQKQQRTVQGVLEEALTRRCNEFIQVTGAGRTDSGVHAVGQVAHFDCAVSDSTEILMNSMNSLLPGDILVRSLEAVPDMFHARFSAVSRTYRYNIRTEPSVFDERYSWYIAFKLNLEKMEKALCSLYGTHIFEPLAKKNEDEKRYRCTIQNTAIWKSSPYMTITIKSDRFLHGMVRSITGILVDVGRGAKQPGIFEEILTDGDRSRVSNLAPPHGLYLEKIDY